MLSSAGVFNYYTVLAGRIYVVMVGYCILLEVSENSFRCLLDNFVYNLVAVTCYVAGSPSYSRL